MITVSYYIFLTVISIAAIPLVLFLCLLIALTDGFPVFFTQKRIGMREKPFVLYKFRTMRAGADKEQLLLREKNEADGPVFKIRNDPRFTRLGKLLSHTGLDELPQLLNIWKGDMAFVGPRPLPVSEANKLTHGQKQRHRVKPGILSPWVMEGYHSKPFAEWMKSDVAYAGRKNIQEDISLTLRALVILPPKLLWRTLVDRAAYSS